MESDDNLGKEASTVTEGGGEGQGGVRVKGGEKDVK